MGITNLLITLHAIHYFLFDGDRAQIKKLNQIAVKFDIL